MYEKKLEYVYIFAMLKIIKKYILLFFKNKIDYFRLFDVGFSKFSSSMPKIKEKPLGLYFCIFIMKKFKVFERLRNDASGKTIIQFLIFLPFDIFIIEN